MAGDETGNGDGGKSNGDNDKVGGQATASNGKGDRQLTATWVMVTVTRLAGNEEGTDEGGKGDGDSDEGGGQQRGNGNGGKSDGNGNNGGRRAMAMATKRVMVTATRVGEVGGQRNGQWQWR